MTFHVDPNELANPPRPTPPKPPHIITLHGFTFFVTPANPNVPCPLCGTSNIPLLLAAPTSSVSFADPTRIAQEISSASDLTGRLELCEPCCFLFSFVWAQTRNVALGPSPYAGPQPNFASVLIVRERPNDILVPFDVLSVQRPNDPTSFSLPGGKLEPGESSPTAAIRELHEETGLISWTGALEPIYQGHSLRGRLGRVYLARAYYGEVKSVETEVKWMPWPMSENAGYASGFYGGMEIAFGLRWKQDRLMKSGTTMSLPLSLPAYEYCQLEARRARGEHKQTDSQMLNLYLGGMTGEEKEILVMITGPATKYEPVSEDVEEVPEETTARLDLGDMPRSKAGDDDEYLGDREGDAFE